MHTRHRCQCGAYPVQHGAYTWCLHCDTRHPAVPDPAHCGQCVESKAVLGVGPSSTDRP